MPPPTVEFGRSSGSLMNRKSAIENTVFTIQSVRKSDEGVYYCRANNSAGNDFQQISIYVNDAGNSVTPDPSDVRVTIEPSEFVASAGEPIRLQCSASLNTLIRSKRKKWIAVHIPSNTQDSGIYVCTVISEQTGNVLNQAEVSVNIGPSRGPATLTIEPERQTVAQGTVAKITCLVGDDPNARVTWRKANENLPSYSEVVGNELRIPQVDVKDRGVYVCEDEKHLLWKNTQRINKPYSPQAQLYFNVESAEANLLQVYAGLVPIIQPLSSHVEVLEGGVLRFTRITEEDDGQYICTAQNLVGTVTAIATLEVTSAPVVTLNPRSPYIVPIGQRVVSNALPEVDQRLRFIGKRRPTTRLRGPVSRPQTAVFEINRAQSSDSKTYTCIAENSAGRVEEKIQVVIVSDPDTIIPSNPTNVYSSIAPDEEIIFPLGSAATLRCNV
ncbi:Basement membrane-specific heparan sulfate proteoglycan core protein, partial [Sarracenia purpurea var. burkii]